MSKRMFFIENQFMPEIMTKVAESINELSKNMGLDVYYKINKYVISSKVHKFSSGEQVELRFSKRAHEEINFNHIIQGQQAEYNNKVYYVIKGGKDYNKDTYSMILKDPGNTLNKSKLGNIINKSVK